MSDIFLDYLLLSSFKWKSSKFRFLALHKPSWPVEFLPEGKALWCLVKDDIFHLKLVLH